MARLLGASLHMGHVDFTAHMVQKCGSSVQIHPFYNPQRVPCRDRTDSYRVHGLIIHCLKKFPTTVCIQHAGWYTEVRPYQCTSDKTCDCVPCWYNALTSHVVEAHRTTKSCSYNSSWSTSVLHLRKICLP